jgi:dethiobiotin synthetase
MRHRLFVTGTDTDVGKTEVAVALLQRARQHHLSTAAMKPVAAGCELIDNEWKNIDAIRLQAQCSIPLHYSEVNPVALKQAMAPHLAAYEEKKTITIERLLGLTQNIFNKKADFTVIEGAGGWRVPISHRELLSQYAKELKLPVLMVVGVRLGCLNHSLLTAEAIMNDGLTIAGWVANIMDKDMMAAEENIQTLQHFLPALCIGVIPFQQDPSVDHFADKLDFDLLIKQLENKK